jgi:hypothetical protein
MRQHEPDQQRLLLAGGGIGRSDVLLPGRLTARSADAARRACGPPRRRARGCRAAPRDSGPRPRRGDGSATGLHPAVERDLGEGERFVAPSRPARLAGAVRSRRPAATATASSAVSCSTASSQCGSGLGRLQQAVARAQAALQRRHAAGVLGVDRERQPVEKPPPLGRRADEQRVHGRREPDHAQMIGESRGGAHRLAVDPAGRCAAYRRRRRFDAGAERGEPEHAFDFGGDRPGSVALGERHVVQRGAAQPAARARAKRWLRSGWSHPHRHQHVERALRRRRSWISVGEPGSASLSTATVAVELGAMSSR